MGGLDYLAMYKVAETMELEVTSVMLHKVRLLEQRVIERKPKPEGKNG